MRKKDKPINSDLHGIGNLKAKKNKLLSKITKLTMKTHNEITETELLKQNLENLAQDYGNSFAKP